jgi:hypothetical protein
LGRRADGHDGQCASPVSPVSPASWRVSRRRLNHRRGQDSTGKTRCDSATQAARRVVCSPPRPETRRQTPARQPPSTLHAPAMTTTRLCSKPPSRCLSCPVLAAFFRLLPVFLALSPRPTMYLTSPHLCPPPRHVTLLLPEIDGRPWLPLKQDHTTPHGDDDILLLVKPCLSIHLLCPPLPLDCQYLARHPHAALCAAPRRWWGRRLHGLACLSAACL